MDRFSINSTSGSISTNEPINPTTFSGAILTIRATDSAPMSRSSTTKVFIKSPRAHLTTPSLPEDWSNLKISAACRPRTYIATVPSFSPHQERYSFTDGCESLEINFGNGMINTKGSMDEVNFVNCSIMIANSQEDNYSVPLMVKIVSNEKIHAEQTSYVGYIRENALSGMLNLLFLN